MFCSIAIAAAAIAVLVSMRAGGPAREMAGTVEASSVGTSTSIATDPPEPVTSTTSQVVEAAAAVDSDGLYLRGQRLSMEPGGASSDQVSTVTSAMVCVVTSRECFVAPVDYGSNPRAELVELRPGKSALLFRVSASASGSGTSTMLSMLDLKDGRFVTLAPDIRLSEQSEYAFWREPEISDAPILVTADYIAGPGETRFAKHRFRIQVFVVDATRAADASPEYILRLEYVTDHFYPSFDEVSKIDVLSHERKAVLERLKRE